MKKIFLTSYLGCIKKVNGTNKAAPINNENKIVNQIKENLKEENNFLFFASTPENYEKNKLYSKLTFDSFNMSGFNFKNLIIIDNNYSGDLKKDIANADLIFLAGGNTYTQIKFFNKLNLKELLKTYSNVIIGQSAGALNLAKNVVCTPEDIEEIGTNYVWKGLNQTNINIEPHFKPEVYDKDEKKLREELLKISHKYKIYAICDGTHIFDNGLKQTIYGETYLIKNGKIKKICDNKKFITNQKTI